jgi:DUF4097 and DUF4098 domain-containing protein YvlB
MSDSGLGFGGFLLGLGTGWYIFRYIEFSLDLVGYFLILLGVVIIINGLLNRGRREHPISKVLGGVIGGLVLATFLTQGFGIVTSISHEFSDFSGNYRASETLNLNSPVTGDAVELSIDSVNGGIEVYSWTGDSVKFDVTVRAKGNSDSEAENYLTQFTHDLSSQISGGAQDISLSFPISNQDWNKYSVDVEVYVPSDVSTSYILDTTNGGISFDDVVADSIDAETTNGAINARITASTTTLSTTNGGIDVTLSKASGKHVFSTTNGGIDISLPTGSDVGYKVNLDTSIGSVDVNLPNMEYSVDSTRSKIGETSSYMAKPIQIEITADTTIGGVTIN